MSSSSMVSSPSSLLKLLLGYMTTEWSGFLKYVHPTFCFRSSLCFYAWIYSLISVQSNLLMLTMFIVVKLFWVCFLVIGRNETNLSKSFLLQCLMENISHISMLGGKISTSIKRVSTYNNYKGHHLHKFNVTVKRDNRREYHDSLTILWLDVEIM